jgi:hypothetical protein
VKRARRYELVTPPVPFDSIISVPAVRAATANTASILMHSTWKGSTVNDYLLRKTATTITTPDGKTYNVSNVPIPLNVGTWGVCHGSGVTAEVIRRATESWAGHAVMSVGGGKVVEATWPRVRLADAPTSNVIWANGQTLTAAQRSAVVTYATQQIGDRYDVLAYPFLAAAIVDAAITKNVSRLFADDRWWDCSGLVAECDVYAGAAMPLGPASAHFVTPAMLMNLGAQEGWFTQ